MPIFSERNLPRNLRKTRKLKITLVSAHNLPSIHWRMKVYAVVSVNNGGEELMRTGVDFKGKTNPEWRDSSLEYTIKEGSAASDDLVVKLYCKRSVKKDMLVWEGEIKVKEYLLQQWQRSNQNIDELHHVVGGFLNISYSFHDSWQ